MVANNTTAVAENNESQEALQSDAFRAIITVVGCDTVGIIAKLLHMLPSIM